MSSLFRGAGPRILERRARSLAARCGFVEQPRKPENKSTENHKVAERPPKRLPDLTGHVNHLSVRAARTCSEHRKRASSDTAI